LALVGVSPALIVMSGAINLIYQYWIHTEIIDRIGPFEAVLNSPSHHRVHHGSNPQYLDKNYGGIFIVWDRLFGTYEREVEPVAYGLTKNIHSYNLFTIAFHEWRALARDIAATPRWRDRFGRLYHGPGWEPAAPLDAAPAR
jgi:sterol desaturase/sphingolipid hydroxylase (fatty acid hydroxylase superfamily)